MYRNTGYTAAAERRAMRPTLRQRPAGCPRDPTADNLTHPPPPSPPSSKPPSHHHFSGPMGQPRRPRRQPPRRRMQKCSSPHLSTVVASQPQLHGTAGWRNLSAFTTSQIMSPQDCGMIASAVVACKVCRVHGRVTRPASRPTTLRIGCRIGQYITVGHHHRLLR